MKKRTISHVLPLTLAALFLSAPFVFAQTANNTMTLSTYYPAPFGAYDTLYLKPRSPTPACQVGIGTTEPQARLDVDAPGGTVPLFVTQRAALTSTPVLITLRAGSDGKDTVGAMGIYSGTGDVRFQGTNGVALTVGSAGVGSLGVYLNSSGNIGMGTTEPNARLDIKGLNRNC